MEDNFNEALALLVEIRDGVRKGIAGGEWIDFRVWVNKVEAYLKEMGLE